MRLVLGAMAHQSHRAALGELLEKPQREFLPMVLDGLVSPVYGSALEKFFPVAKTERAPTDPAGKELLQQLLARPEICHPDVVSGCGHAATPKSRGQDSQSILLRLDGRED